MLGRLIRFHLAEFNECHSIFEITLEPRKGIQTLFEIGAFAHDFLRGIGIIPEIGIFDLRVQFREAACCGIDVKDASSAVPPTA